MPRGTTVYWWLSETFENLKEWLEALKGALQSKGLRINVEKTKIMIDSENAGTITVGGNFPCAVCRKCVGRNCILCHFCWCWVNKRPGTTMKIKLFACFVLSLPFSFYIYSNISSYSLFFTTKFSQNCF